MTRTDWLTMGGRVVALLMTCGMGAAIAAPLPPALVNTLKTAPPGTTVSLPAGQFEIYDLKVGPGVKLCGAGYDRTTLKVNSLNGLTLMNAAGAEVADLTVRGAAGCNLFVENSAGVAIRRVRLMGGLSGLQAVKCAGLRVECAVTVGNRTGMLLNDCDNAVVVNTTMVRAESACLSVVGGTGVRVFNNVFANSPLGVVVGETTANLLLDHNLYQVSRIGKWKDAPPYTVWSWRDQTGHDARSVQLAVEFEDEAAGKCRPLTPLPWAPGLPTTGLWGVRELGGVKAPATDIAGMPLAPLNPAWKGLAPVNVGAFNARGREEAADGTFEIKSQSGLVSAGLYTPEGKLAAWLFQTLPLRQGVYPYWLPTRDWQNRPLPAGNYELRLTEADLRMKPVGNGLAGTTATGTERSDHGAIQAQQPLFDSQGRLVYCLGWSESGMNVRAFEADFGTQRWSFHGTSAHAGFAADGQGALYSLRQAGAKGEYSLLKLSEETGATTPFKTGVFSLLFKGVFSDKVSGLAALGDRLFVADTGADKLFVGEAGNPEFKQGFAVVKPSSPCADPQRNLLWVLSANRELLGLNPDDGSVKLKLAAPVEGLHSFAITGNRLAAVSYTTGKVHLFDITDPAKPKALNAFSAGFGARKTFLFQGGDPADGKLCRVALRADGTVAVVDSNGIKFFSPDGTLARELTGGWYNSFHLGVNDPVKGQELIDPAVGGRSWWLNGKSGKADPGRSYGPAFRTGFRQAGFSFGLSQGQLPVEGQPRPKPVYFVSRIEADGKVVPVLGFRYEGHPIADVSLLTRFTDGQFPAKFVDADWQPAPAPEGKKIRIFNGSAFNAAANGDLCVDASRRFSRIPLKGVSAQGVPDYDWAAIATASPHLADLPGTTLTYSESGTIVSPHDGRTEETPSGPPNTIPAALADGSLVRLTSLKTGRMAAHTGNWGGTDAALFDTAGNLRWYLPLPEVNSTIGPYVVDDTVYLCGVVSSELQIVDRDGLILGRCGQPAGLPWGGKWLDNTLQFAAFKGNDGRHNVIYGNFNECSLYWFTMDGLEKVRKTVQKVSLSKEQVARLATLPVPAAATAAQPAPVRITIKKTRELAIDGDLKKWRALLPIPQAILTPDAGAGIAGPADCSALLRFAHDGANLYVQCIKFDNAIAMGNPGAMFFRQDGLEMCINGFARGFKFNVTRLHEKGDIILRDRFYGQPPDKLLDSAKALRRIDVLDSAALVTERKFIEDVYGVDLSKSKVMITEFKLPLDEDTYEGDVKVKPAMGSGSTIWIGIFVNDNDMPGGDIQHYIAWPSTYGTFSSVDTGALATFE
jgi:hypothetical protein